MNDTSVSITIITILICHLIIITIGYKLNKTIVSISYLNAIFATGILIFWIIDTLNVNHHFQFSELIVLCIEVCIFIFALYSIIGFHNKNYVKVINYIGLGIHILATTGMLIFMYTFKLNKLF